MAVETIARLSEEELEFLEKRLEKRKRALKHTAQDFGEWHNGKTCVCIPVHSFGGCGVRMICTTCHVSCDLEALEGFITVGESFIPKEKKDANPS